MCVLCAQIAHLIGTGIPKFAGTFDPTTFTCAWSRTFDGGAVVSG